MSPTLLAHEVTRPPGRDHIEQGPTRGRPPSSGTQRPETLLEAEQNLGGLGGDELVAVVVHWMTMVPWEASANAVETLTLSSRRRLWGEMPDEGSSCMPVDLLPAHVGALPEAGWCRRRGESGADALRGHCLLASCGRDVADPVRPGAGPVPRRPWRGGRVLDVLRIRAPQAWERATRRSSRCSRVASEVGPFAGHLAARTAAGPGRTGARPGRRGPLLTCTPSGRLRADPQVAGAFRCLILSAHLVRSTHRHSSLS